MRSQITVTENRFYALEGYLFPDTYEFYVIDDLPDKPSMDTSQYAKQAAEKMYSNFQNKITKKMYARAKELGMTFDEVVTLASIIQKEGTNEENMANISSVFHNRLENMYDIRTSSLIPPITILKMSFGRIFRPARWRSTRTL